MQAEAEEEEDPTANMTEEEYKNYLMRQSGGVQEDQALVEEDEQEPVQETGEAQSRVEVVSTEQPKIDNTTLSEAPPQNQTSLTQKE